MEPFEWGLAAIAVLMAKKSAETTGEVVTKEILTPTIAGLKAGVGKLSEPMRERVSALGMRLQQRLPQVENPFDNPVLLAEMVETETQDPEMAAVVEDVQAQLPPIEIRIDQRKQQGIVTNDSATANFHQKIEQHFS